MQKKVNLNEKNIVHALLENAVFSEFSFSTSFCLGFVRCTEKTFDGKEIPKQMNLSVLGEWYFGDKNEWNETVRKLTDKCNFIEPDEPVLVYKLTALRWNGNATVISVGLTYEKLELTFDNGETITILNNEKIDSSWEIWERTDSCTEENKQWYVIGEEDGIYYNIPQGNFLS